VSEELVEHWVDGWVHTRRLRVERVLDQALIHVGSTSRRTEIVCVDPSATLLHELLHHIDGDRGAMLTVLAADLGPHRATPLPSGVRVDRDDETFMTTSLRENAVPAVDPTFRTRWHVDGDLATYSLERDRRVAAEGTVGLLGEHAVLDAVETLPRFRRQGLGRHVLAALTAHAVRHGATTGLLVATPEGRALYESAGWSPTLPMWSLMGFRD